MDEHYHSTKGARRESEHVYIRKGLRDWCDAHPEKQKVTVLEVGFGTGLNALLAYNFAQETGVEIEYLTLEPYPISVEMADKLDFNFTPEEKRVFRSLHEATWDEEWKEGSFCFRKKKEKLEDFNSPKPFDVVFFDAFAPNKQKNMWTSGNLSIIHSVLSVRSGILTTYCSQGEFRRTAQKVGFEVEKTDGPPGKRDMVRLRKVN